ncbi:extracellular mutant protein 11-domain-containing protein [Chaetomium sp. MPI-SDFR-AT-0129]|nr:extracellular mutant protein 11-domain-containing protein [Chaetomium sp. MPI-SDFR-AT-0129]
MPSSKKRLGSISLFLRQGDGSTAGGGSGSGSGSGGRSSSSQHQSGSTSSARAGIVGLPIPATGSVLSGSSVANGNHPSQLPQLQPPHEIIAARQERKRDSSSHKHEKHEKHEKSDKQDRQDKHERKSERKKSRSPSKPPSSSTIGAAAAAQQQQHQQTPATVGTASPTVTTAATASTRSIPVPKSGRHSSASQSSATMSPPIQQQQGQQHLHPLHRTRTSASDTQRDRGHNAWEDSTVASMFGDNESRSASDRLRGTHAHARHYSDAPPPQRALPAPPSRSIQPKHDENLPFVIGENGILKVVPPLSTHKAPEKHTQIPNNNNTAAATNAHPVNAAQGGIFDDQSIKQDDIFHQEASQVLDTPTKASGLRRTKLPYRDTTRDHRDIKSNASSEQNGGLGYSPSTHSVSLSPERQPSEPGGHIDKIRLQERMARERERQREREREKEKERERERQRQRETEHEIEHKRSTLFRDLTPLLFDDPEFNETKAAVISPSTIDPAALQEAQDRTPRAKRNLLQPEPLFMQQANSNNKNHHINHNNPSSNNLLNDAAPPLGRTNSKRRQKSPPKELAPALGLGLTNTTTTTTTTSTTTPPMTNSRKRRQSLDYNDAELHAMSYADLRAQAFDFDPQTAALQQPTAPPTGGTIEDRLEHYRRKGSMDQHEFFAQRVSLDEWEEAGDWFLSQFGDIMQRLRKARRAKRRLVQQFEDEVAAREEAVRGKMEGIARTLEELREDGRLMMEGKEVDVEF